MTPIHQDNIWRGMACAAAMVFFLTLQNTCAKLLTTHYHVVEITFWRNLIGFIPFAIWIILSRRTRVLVSSRPLALAARVFIGVTGVYIIFAALKVLPMADAVTLLFASVFIAPALSHIFLKEHVGPHRWAAMGVGMVGVIVAAGPTGAMSVVGVVLALTGAFFNAGVKTLLRTLKDEPPLGTTFYFLLGGVIISAPFLPFVWTPPHIEDMPLLVTLGLSSALAQVCASFAFRFAPTSLVSPWDYTGLIWASAFDIVIWSVFPTWPVFVGAGIIMASHLYILHREHYHRKT